MGRVNRFGERMPAQISIFNSQVHQYNLYCECKGNIHNDKCRVHLSINELRKIENSPLSEADLVKAANNVYGEGYTDEDKVKYEEGLNHPDINSFKNTLIAGTHTRWIEGVIEKTDGLIEVIPECLLEEYKDKKARGHFIEANSLLVSIRTKSMSWRKMYMLEGERVLQEKYTPEKGLEISSSPTNSNIL